MSAVDALAPDHSYSDFCAIGRNAMHKGDLLTAQHAYLSAIRADKNCCEAYANLAVIFSGTNRAEVAIEVAAAAVDCAPATMLAERLAALGCLYGIVGRFVESEEAILRSLRVEETPGALRFLGLALYSQLRFAESVAAYDRALQLLPGDMTLIDERSVSLLGAGRYQEGLIDNQIRWGVLKAHPYMHSDVPEWRGEPLDGKTIAVLHEQGYGDTFQFVRFLPRLRRMGARVILSAAASALELFQLANLADEYISVRDIPDERVDYKVPMLTVAAHLDVHPSSLSGEQYLFAPLRKPILPKNGRRKIGLVWGGKPMYAQDRWRSMPISELLPLVRRVDADFYSLQQDDRRSELRESGLEAFVTDLSGYLTDWSATAALMAEMDAIVTVDTAPAHVAGAMHLPVYLALPAASCWRWWPHYGDRTTWYPTMRVFRQRKQGDWSPVISDLGEALSSCRR